MSHEIGEWYDDPFTNNRVPCTDNSILENGDPLVLHDFPYTISGFNYHLQDLGIYRLLRCALETIPVNNWLSFQNDEKNTCPRIAVERFESSGMNPLSIGGRVFYWAPTS